MTHSDFQISSVLPISRMFLDRKLTTFMEACKFITDLPYGRNQTKEDLSTVLTEERGTCSTKHAILKQLAVENHAGHVRLMLGIFKMSKESLPQVAGTLSKNGLQYIPEAHNYLRIDDEILDCTAHDFLKGKLAALLLKEIEIDPKQITDFKVEYHQSFLGSWVLKNTDVKLSFEQLWSVREKCIEDLSQQVKISL